MTRFLSSFPDILIFSIQSWYSYFIQQKVKNLYHPDDFLRLEKEFSLETLEKLCYQKHQKFAGEYRRIFGTQYRWVSLTISFWEGDGKGKWGILALQDIHLQKQREETNQLALEDAYQAAKKANSFSNLKKSSG